MKRKPKSLCMFCFGELDFKRVCKSCGKAEDKFPTPTHHLPQRTVLKNKYVISRTLGEGGFGITYLAYDLVFNKAVAIKEYYPNGHVSRNPHSHAVMVNSKENTIHYIRGLKRFIGEAKILSSIRNHDGIVNILDFFTALDTAYIVMEYLDGVSLKKYVQKKGKLDTETTLTILHPTISSLSSVHAMGYIHRDISPDNILITRDSDVKLIDFGASQKSDDNRPHSIVLKQGFAPEEQYRQQGIQGPWSDVYAMGITIYYCITGTLPPESIQRTYDDTLIPPSKLGADISRSQENALMKAISVKARDRYQTISEFEREIYGAKRETFDQQKPIKIKKLTTKNDDNTENEEK